MKKSFAIALFSLALLAAAGTAQAVAIFRATLTGDQEVPAQPNEGSGGTAVFTLNDAMTSLHYEVQLFGLDLRGVDPLTGTPGLPIPGDANPNDNVTRMHIHRAVAGVSGGIVFGMIDASAGLRNDLDALVIDISGLHVSGDWDLTEGNSAIGATLATELDDLFAHGLYINVHTSDHGGGEIRGQIIPEPSTLALLGFAALGLVLPALRRRA